MSSVQKKSARFSLADARTICCILLIALVQPVFGGTLELEELIQNEMKQQHIVGLTAAIVKNEKLVWTKGFGLANKEKKLKVVDSTPFLIASVSKAVTSVALMTLYDRGLIALDDPINTYLPFAINHPRYPNSSITFRMLLAHTSGISDEGYDDLDLYAYGKDSSIALKTFIRDYFTPEGRYYDADRSFTGDRPGTSSSYSNMGFALLGYLVEVIAKTPFDQYCKNVIFKPLQMNRTAWFLRELPLKEIAMPYSRKGKPYGHYTFPDYPNGQLRTTATDLSHFLSMFIQYGTYKGHEILKRATVELMRRVSFPKVDPEMGLGWFYQAFNRKRFFGHNGGEQGVTSNMFFNPKTGVGGIVISTGDDNDLDRILLKLIETGEG